MICKKSEIGASFQLSTLNYLGRAYGELRARNFQFSIFHSPFSISNFQFSICFVVSAGGVEVVADCGELMRKIVER